MIRLVLQRFFIFIFILPLLAVADDSSDFIKPGEVVIKPVLPKMPLISYLLIDANSHKVIAAHNSDKIIEPASLTKMMTAYVVSSAIESGQISLDDKVVVSHKAYKTPGASMFLKQGEYVKINDLMKGLIIASGNDAATVLADYVGGSQEQFVAIMNETASQLGMKNTNFANPTGLPNKNHYSTADDLVKLGQAIERDHPSYFSWYKEKWFKHNGIKQANRNRLLWTDQYVDGIKTGHTDSAGFCLLASSKKGNMKLIAAIMGAKNDHARTRYSASVLNFGYRFFDTKFVNYGKHEIDKLRVYNGSMTNIPVGFRDNFYVTYPKSLGDNLIVKLELDENIHAPIANGQKVGQAKVYIANVEVGKKDVVSLTSTTEGNIVRKVYDSVAFKWKSFVQSWYG